MGFESLDAPGTLTPEAYCNLRTEEAHMFTIDSEYRRSDLHQAYGGQRQGGISTPTAHPFIMLFTGKTGEDYGYADAGTTMASSIRLAKDRGAI